MIDKPLALSEPEYRLVRDSLIFRGVDIEVLDYFFTECELMEVPSGTVLIHPSIKNDYFYVVLTGALDVHLDANLGERLLTLYPGDCAGELSVIDGSDPSAMVVASEDGRLMRIGQETLWRLVRASHGFARNLLYVLAKRMRNSNLAIVKSLHQQHELEYIANVDGLTGLFNRRWMNDFFQRQIARALKDNKPMALLLADLDHFKQINDVHGHIVGDEVLCTVASILTQYVRPSDLLARFGGEEFALILPDTSPEEAFHVAERVRAALEETSVEVVHDGNPLKIHLTVSLGITNLMLGDDINRLLTRADQALYRAKKNGRNRVEVD